MKRIYLLGLAFHLAAAAWAQQPPLLKEYVRLGGQALAVVERPKQYFPDVPESAPYFGATGVLRVRSVALGYLDGTYGPSNQLTRAEMAVFLVRAARSAKGLTPDPQAGEYQTSFGSLSHRLNGTQSARHASHSAGIHNEDGHPVEIRLGPLSEVFWI